MQTEISTILPPFYFGYSSFLHYAYIVLHAFIYCACDLYLEISINFFDTNFCLSLTKMPLPWFYLIYFISLPFL